jgi:hypothetical protein
MKKLLFTALLIVTANTVAAKTLTIKHDKKLPTPHDLITKGTILNKTDIKQSAMGYFIAWDKTDDIYWCILKGYLFSDKNTTVTCRLATQEKKSTVK